MRSSIILTLVFSFSPGIQASDETKAPPQWNLQMRALSTDMQALVPDLFDSGPQTPEEIAEFKKKVTALYKTSQGLNLAKKHGTKAPDSDPTLVFLSGLFREELENAYKSTERGSYAYAKSRLKSSMSYCIACHTRDDSGPQFPLVTVLSEPLKKASWGERVKFEVVMRKFDSAYADAMRMIDEPLLLKTNKMALESVINIALTIAVRVKQSPEQALLITQKIKKSDNASTALKEKAAAWDKDIRTWQKESGEKFSSDKELIAKGKALVGLNGAGPYQVITNGEVRYLRATELMHQLLKKYPNSPNASEALYILGRSYEVTNELSFSDLSEKYYILCINMKPHSSIAMSCADAYEDSVEVGYSGSSGLHVPEYVQNKIEKMKELAKKN
ncbi:MAG: hypothetical protein H6623_04015 [Bdellovibrionaceae bacterium]|nr:hypothetical protein [Pseudobdellovibrionaceae bacterium]